MRLKTRISRDNLEEVLQRVRRLTAQEVLIGIPQETTARDGDASSSPITNAEIGYINEFGSPAANIPARPHLRPGVEAALPAITRRLRAGTISALGASPTAADRTLTAVGFAAQNSVRSLITATLAPPLAEATIRRRRTRKIAPRKGEQPLIDTGVYRRSITFVIRPREK